MSTSVTDDQRLPPMQRVAIRFCRMVSSAGCVMDEKGKKMCTSQNCTVMRELQQLRKRLTV
jgi:hypothetical protein